MKIDDKILRQIMFEIMNEERINIKSRKKTDTHMVDNLVKIIVNRMNDRRC